MYLKKKNKVFLTVWNKGGQGGTIFDFIQYKWKLKNISFVYFFFSSFLFSICEWKSSERENKYTCINDIKIENFKYLVICGHRVSSDFLSQTNYFSLVLNSFDMNS